MDELLAHLEALVVKGPYEFRRIVTIQAHASTLTVGIGADSGFVQHASTSGEPPYYVTVGDAGALGHAEFQFHGVHHTEIPRRLLLPLSLTQDVVRLFLETGARPSNVSWEEV